MNVVPPGVRLDHTDPVRAAEALFVPLRIAALRVGGVLTATAAADLSAVDLAWGARRLSQTG